MVGFGLGFAAIGTALLVLSQAATNGVTMEAESGQISACAEARADVDASNGSYVLFGSGGIGCQQSESAAGSQLPIMYNLATLTGTVRYVATTGNDASGTGSINAPYATLSKAISVSSSGETIVLRGGTYRQGELSIGGKSLRIIAYPGEIPVFSGAQSVPDNWTTDGALQYHAYTPQPVTDGSGISFTTGQNLESSQVGKYPDQAWVGTTQLRQVSAKNNVTEGTFWVDGAANRIYLSSMDIAKGSIEISAIDTFLDVFSPNTSLEGLVVTRFSNTASQGGVIKFYDTANDSLLRNVAIYDSAFIALQYIGSANILENNIIENVTIENSNWMGINALFTDALIIRASKISNMNQFNEFTNAPQSGAVKTSRTRYTKVLNSVITNNKNHGLWFDQSNVDVDVAANWIAGNGGSGIFFEISDDLLMINNYIEAPSAGQAVKLAGSSGLKLVNNTILGGGDPIGIYTDERSKPGCADPAQPLCTNSYSSDRDTVRARPATLDWMPRLDLMINNIVGYPARAQYCSVTVICVLSMNAAASAPVQTIFHPADVGRGIPATQMNGNVYANGSGNLIHTSLGSYSTVAAFTSAMAGSPVSISGLDATSKFGNTWFGTDGIGTSALQTAQTEAVAIPVDANINEYITAGTTHYGVTYR
jgi:hypothetical protein